MKSLCLFEEINGVDRWVYSVPWCDKVVGYYEVVSTNKNFFGHVTFGLISLLEPNNCILLKSQVENKFKINHIFYPVEIQVELNGHEIDEIISYSNNLTILFKDNNIKLHSYFFSDYYDEIYKILIQRSIHTIKLNLNVTSNFVHEA